MKILHYVDENNLSWSKPWLQLLEESGKYQNTEQVILCRPGGTLKKQVQSAGFPVIIYKPPAAWSPRLCLGLGRIIREVSPDIIHTRLSSAAALGGYWGRKLKIPVVATVDKYPRKKYYENALAVVASSKDVAGHMKGQGMEDEKLFVVNNSIRVKDYEPDIKKRVELRKKEGILDDETLLLAMGRFVPWKGFDLLIEALSSLETQRRISLWIVGDGPMAKDLKGKAQSLAGGRPGLGIRFFPFTEDVRPFLWAADLFVQPSYYVPGSGGPETFSLALLEALAAGLPSVAFDCGGAPDVIKEGVNGWLAEPGSTSSLAEALRKALGQLPDDKMSLRAKEEAKKNDVSRAARAYREIYDAAIKATSPSK